MHPEIEQYLQMIEDLRGQVADLVRELPEEALNWRPIESDEDHSTNSLAVMAAHVAGAEHFWIAEVVGGQEATRDRPAEFVTEVDTADELLEKLNKVGVQTRAILSKLDEEQLGASRTAFDKTVAVRWAILHVIDHTALHLGHMQITYQLWHHGRANPAPRWFERLP